jgi:hypothetical protein
VLTPAQIQQNYEAGVGEKFFLMFSIEHLTNINDSFIVVEAAQFDSYGYLFRNPFFISLDGAAQPNAIDVRGMRIGLNGAEAHVGQSYANLNTQISSLAYTPESGQVLTQLGAVVPLEKGPDADEFFLTFDAFGTNTFARQPPSTPDPPAAQDLEPTSEIGVRTFDEISATMSVLTGVSQLDPGVVATFDEVRQSLPAVSGIDAFLSSHQASVAALAIEYCHAMVNEMVANPALAAQRFPGFPFTAGTAVAWPAAGSPTEDLFLNPLLDRVLGVTQLGTQPARQSVKDELTDLVHGGVSVNPPRPGLVAMGPTTDAARTQAIAKAVCAAAVGNGATLVQ